MSVKIRPTRGTKWHLTLHAHRSARTMPNTYFVFGTCNNTNLVGGARHVTRPLSQLWLQTGLRVRRQSRHITSMIRVESQQIF